MALTTGVGPYELVAPIGTGGMGSVFKARQRGAVAEAPFVALKLLHRVDSASLARFERERRLQASLGENEGFVPLLDAGEGSQGPYIVMPLLAGGTLRQRLEREPLPEEEAIALLSSIAKALGKAHALGIVHRDLKPENVLFTEDGRPLVADLGLAKHFEKSAPGGSQSVSLSRSGAALGTAGYMAPEQMADGKTVGPPADVFSLGAILHECLTGAPAFSGDSVIEVMTKVEAGTFEPLAKRCPGGASWLQTVVSRALAHAPEERFPDAIAFARALHEGVATGGPRRRLRALLALALLAGAATGSVFLARAHVADAETLACLARAREREVAGDHDAAIAETSRAIELEPGLASAWVLRGAARRRKGDVALALADLDHAIALAPGDAEAWAERAIVRATAKDHEGATKDANAALALAPKLARAWYALGQALVGKGDPAGANAAYCRGLEADPNGAQLFHGRAMLKAARGDLDGAIADYSRAVELDPKLENAWVQRSFARFAKGDADGCAADCTRAIELNPRDSVAYGQRAIARESLGDSRGSIADAERALALDPTAGPRLYPVRGFARHTLGDLDGAIADFTRAIERLPDEALPYFGRAKSRDKLGDGDGAASDYARYLELMPASHHRDFVRQRLEELGKRPR